MECCAKIYVRVCIDPGGMRGSSRNFHAERRFTGKEGQRNTIEKDAYGKMINAQGSENLIGNNHGNWPYENNNASSGF